MRVGGYLLGVLISVLSASLLLRHLGVENMGRYGVAMTFVAIVGAFSDLGLTAIGIRELARLPENERWPVARDLLGLRVTLTVVGAVIAIAIALVAYSGTIAFGVALACVGLLLQTSQDNFSLPLLLGLRLGWISALELLRQLLSIALTIVLVLIGASLVPFLGISIPVGIAAVLCTLALVHRTRKVTPTFNVDRWRVFIRPMLPYTVAVAAAALYLRICIFLLSALSSATQLGYFSASFRIVEVLTIVPGLLVSSAFPIFARAAKDDHERLGYGVGRVFEVSLIVGAWVSVSIATGAPLAIAIVGGSKFSPSAGVLAIQGVAIGAMFVSQVWAYALLSLGLYRQILLVSVSLLIVNGALVAALVPLDGARGAALGTALAEVLAAVVQAVAVIRGRPQLRPSLRIVPRIALASVISLIPLMAGLPSVAALMLSTGLFAGGVLLLRILPREIIDMIQGVRLRLGS